MLSRIGVFKGLHSKSLVFAASRCLSTTTPVKKEAEYVAPKDVQRLVRQEPGKVRMGFIPEELFTFFYKKTGVTGPYTFGIGVTTYLLSKEFYVLEHEFYNGISLFILLLIIIKKLGPPIAQFLDKGIDDYETALNSSRVAEKEGLGAQIEAEKKNQWSVDGQLMVVHAKRENVALQLEAAYRQRLMHVYGEVKKRLDYHFEREKVERRIAQKHLVNWVLQHVLASITTEQEKQNIDKCIADLAIMGKV